jgi:tRNA(Met) C34 N-acetyltransferase TmcA
MTGMTVAKLALAAIGVIVWSYGYRVDDPSLRWVGIAFLAAAALLRFWPRLRPPAA